MTLMKVSNQKPTRSIFDDLLFTSPFTSLFDGMSGGSSDGNFIPAVNISETEKDFNLEFSVPGFKKDGFKIELEKNLLTVSAEEQTENKDENKNYSRREFNFRSFRRTFTLPESVDAEQIKARYEDGILHLQLPKRKEAIAPARQIKIS